jgi:hypothetical protein
MGKELEDEVKFEVEDICVKPHPCPSASEEGTVSFLRRIGWLIK